MLGFSSHAMPGRPVLEQTPDWDIAQWISRMQTLPAIERFGPAICCLERTVSPGHYDMAVTQVLEQLTPMKSGRNEYHDELAGRLIQRLRSEGRHLFVSQDIKYCAIHGGGELDVFAVRKRDGKLLYENFEIKTGHNEPRAQTTKQVSRWLRYMEQELRVPRTRLAASYIEVRDDGAYIVPIRVEMLH